MLIDDEITADEFAAELSQRNCTVAVQRAVRSRGQVVLAEELMARLA